MDIRAIRIHLEEVGHQMTLAGDILGITGRAEDNRVVRQVQGLYVRDMWGECELPQGTAVTIDFV